MYLADIPKSAKGDSTLHIDMTIILRRQVWAIRDQPRVVNHVACSFVCSAIVRVLIAWVSIIIQVGHICKGLWILFGTFSILHARCS